MNSAEVRARRTGLRLGAVASASLAALLLAGCVSTQQKAAWLHVEDARVIASQRATVVRVPSSQVRVESVRVLHHGGRLAIVVVARNLSARTLADLPISVGMASGHRRIYLNRAAGRPYFESHLAALPPRGTVAWVLTARPHASPAGRPFAVVGARPDPTVRSGRSLPSLSVRVVGVRADRITFRVVNRSSAPQAQLPVYALSTAGGRLLGAGAAILPDVEPGQTSESHITLVGASRGAVRLEALPTMFLG